MNLGGDNHTFGLAPDGGVIHKYLYKSGNWIPDGDSTPNDRDSFDFKEGDGYTKLCIVRGNPYNQSDNLFFYIEYQDTSFENNRYRLYVDKPGYK